MTRRYGSGAGGAVDSPSGCHSQSFPTRIFELMDEERRICAEKKTFLLLSFVDGEEKMDVLFASSGVRGLLVCIYPMLICQLTGMHMQTQARSR